MKQYRNIGLECRDGFNVGRDPRAMSPAELERLGHRRISPLKALRLKCLDCCNGSAQEVRLCTAVDCSSWPFRMGRNPWVPPLSSELRAARQKQMLRNRAAETAKADETQAKTTIENPSMWVYQAEDGA